MNPPELKYSKEHEWVKVDGDTATIGITDHAQEQLTDIVFVEMPDVGKKIDVGANIGVVESVKSVSDVFSPVSGEVKEVNSKLEAQPELVNKDPYGQGWIARIKMDDKKQLDDLMDSKKYEEFTK